MLSQSKRKIALFAALCLFCSMIEFAIPKPVFIRLGFSNSPLLIALYCSFSPLEFFFLVLLKIFVQGFINGTLFSYAFILSASGGLLSSFTMFVVYKLFAHKSVVPKAIGRFQFKVPSISMISISEAGALVSNLVQIYVSRFFLGEGVYALSPLIMGCGIVSSFVLGFLTQLFCTKSRFLNVIKDPAFFAAYLPKPVKIMSPEVKVCRILKIVFSVICLTVCLFTERVALSGVMSLILLVACIYTKRRVRITPIIWTIFRTVAISLFVPAGRILFSMGGFKITQDSIFLGLHRSFVILSSTFFSRFLVPKPQALESAFKPDNIVYLTLDYFKEVSEEYYKIKEKNLAKRIDKTLLNAIKKVSNVS